MCRLLGGEGEQHKDVDPDSRHGVPVPRGDVDDDSASFDVEAAEPRGHIGEKKGKQPTGEMKSVHGGKDVDEGTARAPMKMKSPGRQVLPGRQLSGQEHEAQDGGKTEPGKMTLIAERNAGNGFYGCQSGLTGNCAAGAIDGETAGEEGNGVDEQNPPRQFHGNPVAEKVVVAGADESAPRQINGGEGEKQHQDWGHGDGQAKPRVAQAFTVVRQGIGLVLAAIAPAPAAISSGMRRHQGPVVASGTGRNGGGAGHSDRREPGRTGSGVIRAGRFPHLCIR